MWMALSRRCPMPSIWTRTTRFASQRRQCALCPRAHVSQPQLAPAAHCALHMPCAGAIVASGPSFSLTARHRLRQGLGCDELLPAILQRVPPPAACATKPLRLLLFDSWCRRAPTRSRCHARRAGAMSARLHERLVRARCAVSRGQVRRLPWCALFGRGTRRLARGGRRGALRGKWQDVRGAAHPFDAPDGAAPAAVVGAWTGGLRRLRCAIF